MTKTTKPKPVHDKTCGACGAPFTTHKPKAKRCQPCIDAGRKDTATPRATACLSCGEKFTPDTNDQRICPACIPEGLSAFEAEALLQDRLDREMRRQERWRDTLGTLERIFAREARKQAALARGKPRMTRHTRDSTLGRAWLEIAARDGHGTSLTQFHDSDLGVDQKAELMLSYHRLRLRGFAPETIATLDPVALMNMTKVDRDRAFEALPVADETDPDENSIAGQSPSLREITLGLVPINRPN